MASTGPRQSYSLYTRDYEGYASVIPRYQYPLGRAILRPLLSYKDEIFKGKVLSLNDHEREPARRVAQAKGLLVCIKAFICNKELTKGLPRDDVEHLLSFFWDTLSSETLFEPKEAFATYEAPSLELRSMMEDLLVLLAQDEAICGIMSYASLFYYANISKKLFIYVITDNRWMYNIDLKQLIDIPYIHEHPKEVVDALYAMTSSDDYYGKSIEILTELFIKQPHFRKYICVLGLFETILKSIKNEEFWPSIMSDRDFNENPKVINAFKIYQKDTQRNVDLRREQKDSNLGFRLRPQD